MSSDQPQVRRPADCRRTWRPRALLLFVLACTHAGTPAALVGEATNPSDTVAPIREGLVASATSSAPPAIGSPDASPRTAFLSRFKPQRPPLYDSLPHQVTPHPAVARIIVPEGRSIAFGSGTLVDVWGEHGLVVTNWHVVRDSAGVVEVVFPCGFRSNARPLKVDSNWDLAALVIWRPPVEPVKFAAQPPRPGDPLTIHGYGRGQYRIATGRCTKYYSPRINYPHELVELDAEARQGDSGGPIFNDRGELAGVLFGAGQGTTLGSFAPRVRHFLATIAPDLGKDKDQPQVAAADRPAPEVRAAAADERPKPQLEPPSSPWSPPEVVVASVAVPQAPQAQDVATNVQVSHASEVTDADTDAVAGADNLLAGGWYDSLKSALAAVGIAAIALQLIKAVR